MSGAASDHAGGPPRARVNEGVRAPSHAERSRTLAATHKSGLLATLAREPAGYPFGSLVSHALDAAGHPLLLLSGLAEHTKNLAADPRASLLVTEPAAGDADPLALGRVTLLGKVTSVVSSEREVVSERYLASHPKARMYLAMKDFAFYRLTVESLRYVGGFGRMSWVSAEEYLAAEADPLAEVSRGILEHMNQDHASALVVYARAWAGIDDATFALMTGVDRYGLDLSVTTPAGPRPARLAFESEATDPEAARRQLVALAVSGRKKLAAMGSGNR